MHSVTFIQIYVLSSFTTQWSLLLSAKFSTSKRIQSLLKKSFPVFDNQPVCPYRPTKPSFLIHLSMLTTQRLEHFGNNYFERQHDIGYLTDIKPEVQETTLGATQVGGTQPRVGIGWKSDLLWFQPIRSRVLFPPSWVALSFASCPSALA